MIAVLCLLLVGGPAAARPGAERPGALTLPQAKFYGYATPVVVVQQGEAVTYTNIDTDEHDLVHDTETDGFGSEERKPWCKEKKGKRSRKDDGHAHDHGGLCPMFWSELIGLGESTPILGLGGLKPGATYAFFCTRHHSMKGILVVN